MLKKLRQTMNVLKFAMGSTRPAAGPLKVQWDILYRCNSRCVTCDRWVAQEGQTVIPLSREKEFLAELAALGTFSVAFSGGEPFLRKDIFELIAEAKRVGLTTSLNSNGLLINEKMAARIVESGLDMIYLSLDGATPATNDYIRGVPGGFAKTFAAVRVLREQRGAKPKIFINCTVNNLNVGELVELARLCREAQVDGVTMQPAHSCEGMDFTIPEELQLSAASIPLFEQQLGVLVREYRDMFPMMDDYFAQFGQFVRNPAVLYKYRCVAAYTSVQVHPNGDVYSCPVAFEKMGNLMTASFKEIWFSPEANALRDKIKNGQHPMCWFTCVAPANIFLSYVHPLRFYKLFRPELLRHILFKIRG